MQYDFIAIGDTVTDAFIRLKEASVHCKMNREACEICMAFGDKIPYQDVWVIPAVGNAANAAVSAARLGLKSALVTNIGGDIQGKECLAALGDEKVGTEFVAIHPDAKTNYHYVLWYEDDRTILIKHEKYDYALPDVDDPKWIYLSSLGEHGEDFHDRIADYLESHPVVKLAFQPGTFQIRLGKERLKRIYARTEVFFCNRQEAERITGMPENTSFKILMMHLRALGPKIVVVTDGPLGAYCYDDQDRFWQMPIYPDPKPPFERTGAGDAFSSTFTAALAMDMTITDALRWAPVNSMSVVQSVGAREGLLTHDKIEEWLKKMPTGYQPKNIYKRGQMKSLREVIADSEARRAGIGHFNISDAATFGAVAAAARETGLPVIIGTSEGELDFLGARQAVALVRSLREEGLAAYLNADHHKSLEPVKKAVAAGCDSVIIDASNLPMDEDIALTKQVVDYVRSTSPEVLVEGELGYIGSGSEVRSKLPEGAAVRPEDLTTPEDAARFVRETGVDLFAPAVGNLHGMFADAPDPALDIARIRAIKEAVKVPLVLHGGSGNTDEDFRAAVQAGINVVHISTQMRVAWRHGLEESLAKMPNEVAPYKLMKTSVEAVRAIVVQRLKLFAGL